MFKRSSYSRFRITNRIRAETLDALPDYAAARARVEALDRAALLNERALVSFLREGSFEETTICLALISKLPVQVLERALLQRQLEPFLIVGRALDLSWLTVKMIMCIGPHQPRSPLDLEQYRANFDRLKPITAQKLLCFYRAHPTFTSKAMRD